MELTGATNLNVAKKVRENENYETPNGKGKGQEATQGKQRNSFQ